ncbi:hypothetical protein [Shimazuella alba]|uniref:Uncharacterized protein n=1 Tax=Shimazuella alba TaxID=2690964 RepID=A0A6I4VY76_9BACL|nr:hypothetical protein [Shimazuella alba]MXQ55691.1 hypothetical protein [Shimazuella alba]
MQSEKNKKGHMGWRILGYVLVVLTVLLSIGAIVNLASGFNSSDIAESIGKVIGAVLFPVACGYLARYSLRKSRK